MISPLKFSPEFLSELLREKQKLSYMIGSGNPFAHPLEFSQDEVIEMKQSYNAIIRLLFLSGNMDVISYQQDLYTCPELL